MSSMTVERDNGSAEAADFPCAPPAQVRLNLGAGDCPFPGYVNLDRKTGQEIYPLAYPDNSVDEIRASHVLEHFSHRDIPAVLREWVRILKPGGLLRIAVPNFAWIAQQYLAGADVQIQSFVMGGHVDDDDHHGAIFDEEELTTALRQAGCCHVQPWDSEGRDCSALPVSLNLQARKKSPIPKLNMACAMSVPRLGFQDNFFTWFTALAPYGVIPVKYDGAFWGQCLERVMSDQLDAEWILTVDYDSVFDRDTFEDLVRLAVEHPDADAIAAMQLRRGGDTPLVCVRGETGELLGRIELDSLRADLVPVATAHFGLTLIRTSALRKMPRPWFLEVPGPDGTWGEGRIDPDTYFWRQWEDVGNSLFLAPHVVIAHAQLMLTWPGRGGLQPIHQHPAEFWAKGRPEGAWR